MINDEQVKWFFQNMKERGVLPKKADLYYWTFDEKAEDENVYFRYYVAEKTFGYKMSITSILRFLRDWKLKQIID
jgi:hypothetical protein